MKLLDIFKKTSSSDEPIQLRRKAWVDDKGNCDSFCYMRSKLFYTDLEYCDRFYFDLEHILADDWEYIKKSWVSK